MLEEIVDGLSQSQKSISSKYFYDERGSALFERITRLPEYYPTETELAIMRDNVQELAKLIGTQASLIEFGSGSSLKTRILLQDLPQLAAYVPVDISEDHLLESAQTISRDHPGIEVLPVVADFTQPFRLPTPTVMPLRNIVYFPGSTIGNFTDDAAHELLTGMHGIAGANGALLIGVDLQKDRDVLRRAYNDSQGVTAQFNLNMLRHINSETGADFNLDTFQHKAIYDENEGRIEMYLVSTAEQTVNIGDARISLDKGERILTEYSHKYTLDGFARLARRAGFEVQRVWMDDERLFSVQYLARIEA